MHKKPIIEACVETYEQAERAKLNGADRIELCSDLSVGGLTPLADKVVKIQQQLHIPIMAMVRPRSGNFVYSSDEIARMRETIDLFKNLKIKGVVFGFLTKDNEVDAELTDKMAKYASPLEVTFHKAIDDTPDLLKSVNAIKKIPNIQRILSSGGMATAFEGKGKLVEMQKAAGSDLTIIAAGKVTVANLPVLHRAIGLREYHGKKIVFD